MSFYFAVKDVKPLNDYQLLITFKNQEKKIFDVKPYLKYSAFQSLKDVSIFNQVHTNGETVVWNDDIDIAPEYLYENSRKIK